MSFKFTDIKRYKKGAKWDDGSPRYCTRCGALRVNKRKRAKVTALFSHDSSEYVMPVGYCPEHVPDELKQ